MSRFTAADISFSHVADLYLAETRRGEAPSIEMLADAFPHLADEIRNQLPALGLLENTIGKKTEPPPVRPSDELGGCEIIRELGRGAVGIVYEALQVELGRKVAVKVIPMRGVDAPIAIERFELERQAMGRVEHPHIVPVYSYGHNSKHAFLVMKLIDGHSLYDLQIGNGDYRTKAHMAELTSSWEAFAELGSSVAAGLHHAHNRGMVHRDIKPANLILDTSGKCWITDFGLAKLFDYSRSLSRTGDAIGTPRYMAPEQLRGVCDARSDVYALGITLYELAAGRKVWEDQSNVSLICNRDSMSLRDIAEIRPDLPAELCKIIMKACSFSPSDRYQSANEMSVVLDRLLAGASKGDRRRRKREPDEVFRRRSRRNMVLSFAGVIGLSIGAGWIYTELKLKDQQLEQVAATQAKMPVAGSAVRLIDKLANENEGDMVDIVTEFVGESLGASGDNLQFTSPAQTEIRHQVENLSSTIKEEGLTEESLNRFLKGYRNTSLPVATKVMRLSIVVANSRLTDSEKKSAVMLLQKLAGAVVRKQIRPADVDELAIKLTGRDVKSVEEINTLQVSDTHLRTWLFGLERRLQSVPEVGPEDEQAIALEVQKAFESGFGRTPQTPGLPFDVERQ
ncbi:serine/threonine protein kinase [Stieleria varia]|uniref:Serine/threonine-protein kinase PrkC n=1 Tax=Stieleria varia TaxID=2528005 RepID=A0A5C6B0M4_9BACT|nr:serine/threonine-protein kinase [Stieleria varia]TWU05009.1 Serine/threonine-protein kinase PrkC [Stieleria varia]